MRVIAIALALCACGGELTGGDAGEPPTDARRIERDGGPEPTLPVPLADALPLGEDMVLRLGPGLELDVTCSFAVDAQGRVQIVFDTFDGAFSFGELWIAS